MLKESFPEPDFSPEPGWLPLPQEDLGSEYRSFVSGDPQGDRLRVRYFRRAADCALMAKVWFGPGAQGPPGHAHGGSMAAVLDEAMGFAAWLGGHSVLAGRISVDFHRMLPLRTVAVVETGIEKVQGRKVLTHGSIRLPEGGIAASGTGVFVQVSAERFGGLRPPSLAAKALEDKC